MGPLDPNGPDRGRSKRIDFPVRTAASVALARYGVRTDPGNAKPPPPGDLGELKWDGASGCYFVIDPKQDMFFVLLEQTPTERQRVQRTLKQLVYESMEK